MSYSSNLSSVKFPGMKYVSGLFLARRLILAHSFLSLLPRGWWSDQLQNKDDTLVAGQANSRSLSVGTSEYSDLVWINLDDITNPAHQAANAKSNIYVCEFNQWRVQVSDPIIYLPCSNVQFTH